MGMITKKTRLRIIDPDRRLDIYPGFVTAPEEFFEKYGNRFFVEKISPKDKDTVPRVITTWAENSRSAERAQTRRMARLAAKKEAEANLAKAKKAAAVEIEEEEEASSEGDGSANEPAGANDEASKEAAAGSPVDKDKLLPPEKAIWKGAKKVKAKKEK